jgi:hypothetical protein
MLLQCATITVITSPTAPISRHSASFAFRFVFRRQRRTWNRAATIWPSETAPVIRRVGEQNEFAQLRWGFPPPRPKASAVINFRSENRHFPKGRCLIPASHFFEFNGAKSPKSKWQFTKAGGGWFCFAGLWREFPDDEKGDAFTLLTTEPVATAIVLFGFQSGAALATVVGVLIEVPVMLASSKKLEAPISADGPATHHSTPSFLFSQ